MGLDVWFRENVTLIQLCSHGTMTSTLVVTPSRDHAQEAACQRGLGAVIKAIVVAFRTPTSPPIVQALDQPPVRVSDIRNSQSNGDSHTKEVRGAGQRD